MNCFIPISFEEYQHIVKVALGKEAATICFENVHLLNVYTGEIEKTNVYTYDKWIAYVGVNDKTPIPYLSKVTLNNNEILVPGYIETHSHPNQMYNPLSLGNYLTSKGTTVSINDNLTFQSNLSSLDMERLANQLEEEEFHIWLWWAYIDSHCKGISDQEDIFNINYLKAWAQRPSVVQAGEFTAWPNLIADDENIEEMLFYNKYIIGKRIEGHLPGASKRTLTTLAAAGITADHEASNSDEVMNRLRLGYYVSLRYSSICPDLPQILEGLQKQKNINYDRLMFTNDGVPANYLDTHTHSMMIKMALDYGIAPKDAYRMATLNPATYYQIDHLIGGIAPGRIANINILKSISDPTPISVMVKGKWIYENGKRKREYPNKLVVEEKLFSPLSVEINDFIPTTNVGIELINDVITKTYYFDEEDDLQESECYLSYINKNTSDYTNSRIKNFSNRLLALASSYSASQDILVIGKNKEMMKIALEELKEMGGGIVCKFEHGTEVIRLPLAGVMCNASIESLAEKIESVNRKMQENGYKFNDFTYSLLFLTATHLPTVRLTKKGIYDHKSKKIVAHIIKYKK